MKRSIGIAHNTEILRCCPTHFCSLLDRFHVMCHLTTLISRKRLYSVCYCWWWWNIHANAIRSSYHFHWWKHKIYCDLWWCVWGHQLIFPAYLSFWLKTGTTIQNIFSNHISHESLWNCTTFVMRHVFPWRPWKYSYHSVTHVRPVLILWKLGMKPIPTGFFLHAFNGS